MIETFKPIPNYPDYQVSNIGRVKSLKKGKEKILKAGTDSHGYLIVTLCSEGKRKTKNIHQLVAVAFLGHNPNSHALVVNHVDFDKLNNHLSNLEIVTQRTNSNLAHIKSSSKYTGVSWYKRDKKWCARIAVNGKCKHLGYFDSEEQASGAYQSDLNKINYYKESL